MAFDATVFWPAMKAAGMLLEAVYQPSLGDAILFDVGFKRPDQVVLDGIVHSTDYTIEYQAADVELARECIVTVIGEGPFKVRNTPMARGDGTFFVATLEKVSL